MDLSEDANKVLNRAKDIKHFKEDIERLEAFKSLTEKAIVENDEYFRIGDRNIYIYPAQVLKEENKKMMLKMILCIIDDQIKEDMQIIESLTY
jgi:hypothetical protein